MQQPLMRDGEAATAITLQNDPREPSIIVARIQAIRRDHVQAEVERLMAIVEGAGGWAMFDQPFRQYNGYAASGRLSVPNLTAETMRLANDS